ncbi:MAG: class I SAM-dependent methyltransferase, partial [Spirochaetaceae bacterium]
MYPLEALSLRRKRRSLLSRARGDVLEIGAGTGVNLGYYDASTVASITMSDLSVGERLRERAASFAGGGGVTGSGRSDSRRPGSGETPVHLSEADAMNLPFPDDSFDTVVMTLVFCSVPDQAAGFTEIRRVLRPGGQ